MKDIARHYDKFDAIERFRIAIEAFGRKDLQEVDRLNETAPYRNVREQDPAYFERLRRLSQLASYISVEVRDLQLGAVTAFCAAMPLAEKDDEESAAKFAALANLCGQAVEKLKATRIAWNAFCAHLDLRPADVDGILPKPVFGREGLLEIVEDILGEVEPEDKAIRFYETHMRDMWHSRIDRLQ